MCLAVVCVEGGFSQMQSYFDISVYHSLQGSLFCLSAATVIIDDEQGKGESP